jgi:hypothetical protein
MEKRAAGHLTSKSSRNTNSTIVKTVSNFRRRKIIVNNEECISNPLAAASQISRPMTNLGGAKRKNQMENLTGAQNL